ncbi:MAG: hypothetical protein K0R65_366 [Crocinitomicaceae bacterium]|jgi:hypothetical protein|nr:hypothetical protein [Crocinitomicaceae bacterium]
MYKVIILLFTLFSGTSSFAHQYYFGFAEVEYNRMDEQLQGTIILSAHDLEDALLKRKVISSKFDKMGHDIATIEALANEIFQNFKCYHKGREIALQGLDFFLTRNGLIEIYFKSEVFVLEDALEFEFSSLMEEFPEQQNKITFILEGNKQTAVFLQDKRRNSLEIKSE